MEEESDHNLKAMKMVLQKSQGGVIGMEEY
jgi:hypothetical protein